ncbi:hypothetical protein AMATHDRAFT_77956 [Amanita thiersii Skay4041]|uniref:CTP synthase n=1 Tax=Amanita thiersii Skay4041 TaxID=703135 RepID=A0A2A9NDG5_9AGAR|nr:hypothetical protein AMATHDRAFT_77956 [Amanita thiersii Skay4041]
MSADFRLDKSGEVYVLNDGGEVDLDLGNYERYLNVILSRDINITTGKIYGEVVEKELGGTVGDIEPAPFVEAMRQFQFRVGHSNLAPIHVSLVLDMRCGQKTFASAQIPCRLLVPQPLNPATKEKISMFCHVRPQEVFGVHDVTSVYHVPSLLQSQGIVEHPTKRLELDKLGISGEMRERGVSLSKRWREITTGYERLFDSVNIALVGNYTDLKDSYMSVIKALGHSAFRVRRKLIISWVESSDLESEMQKTSPARYHDAWRAVVGANGVLVPGGFGEEGMMLAIKYTREQRLPSLLAFVEWARNVLEIPDATSGEFFPDAKHPVIIFMPEISRTYMGGTIRLGLRPMSRTRGLYGDAEKLWGRHRHRYEVNPTYVDRLQKSGLGFVGKDEKGERMEKKDV